VPAPTPRPPPPPPPPAPRSRTYKADPTILAWNLINEPRCETWVAGNDACPATLNQWYSTMAAYVRSQDPNHLVSTGSEGFFLGSNADNPADWAGQSGQDFAANNADMDFAVTHAWPDNWEM
jgi:mannan endo-1,4-beta-mannosidase